MEPKKFSVPFLERFAHLSLYFEHHLFCMAGQGSGSSVDCGNETFACTKSLILRFETPLPINPFSAISKFEALRHRARIVQFFKRDRIHLTVPTPDTSIFQKRRFGNLRTFLFLPCLGLLIFFFQAFRIFMEHLLVPEGISFLKGLLLFRLHHNRGISFSLFASSPEHLRLALLCSLCGMGIFFFTQRKKFPSGGLFSWGSLLLLAGSLSNLGERFFLGSVTDYAGFPFPFFGYLFVNFADLTLLAGAGMLLLSLTRNA